MRLFNLTIIAALVLSLFAPNPGMTNRAIAAEAEGNAPTLAISRPGASLQSIPQRSPSVPTPVMYDISIGDDGLSPKTLTLALGDRVRWTNHTASAVRLIEGAPVYGQVIFIPLVAKAAAPSIRQNTSAPQTAPLAASNWQSGILLPGQSYSQTYALPGAFPFYRLQYPQAQGLLVVLEAPDTFVIPPTGGVYSTERLTITIPGGALTDTTTLRVATLELPFMPEVARPTIHFSLEATNSHGQPVSSLLLPVTLTYHYLDIEMSGLVENSLRLLSANPIQGGWDTLPPAPDAVHNRLTVSLAHFSRFMALAKTQTPPGMQNTDDDGLYDSQEITLGTDPHNPDTDGDGLVDSLELLQFRTDPLRMDSDGDGLEDGIEVNTYGTNPTQPDSDGDTLTDNIEILNGTNPNAADTDNDGLADNLELLHATSPTDPDSDDDDLLDGEEVIAGADGYITYPLKYDSDADGLNDGQEYLLKTDPTLADTDGDTLGDSEEVKPGLDNAITDPKDNDSDNDGLLDGAELTYHCNPLLADSDSDGLPDGIEVNNDTDPLNPDTDGDGLTDGVEDADHDGRIAGDADNNHLRGSSELWTETNPHSPDTDGDQMPDDWEIRFNLKPVWPDGEQDADNDDLKNFSEFSRQTNPQLADSDQDGLSDGQEIQAQANPLQPDSDADGLLDGAEVIAGTNPLLADSDGDKIPDGAEPGWDSDADGDGKLNALDADADNDGLADGEEDSDHDGKIAGDANGNRKLDGATPGNPPEIWTETDPLLPDTDMDGLPDAWERSHQPQGFNPCDPNDALLDPDSDGLNNRGEYFNTTGFADPDSDSDGLPDGLEVSLGLDPNDAQDALADLDGDRLSNLQEYELGAALNNPDSDGDLLWDSVEIAAGADPLNPDSDHDGIQDGSEALWNVDSDGDGLINALDIDSDEDGLLDGNEDSNHDGLIGGDANQNRILDQGETWTETDPLQADSDRDQISDLNEVNGSTGYITNPRKADSDSDGLDDASEIYRYHTNPTQADSDWDNLPDGAEIQLQTNPLDPDADWDSLKDGDEVAAGASPFIPNSDRDGLSDSQDPWPLNPDFDQDGLLDGQELVDQVNGLRLEVEDFALAQQEDISSWQPDPDKPRSVTGGVAADSSGLIGERGLALEQPAVQFYTRWDFDSQAVGYQPPEWRDGVGAYNLQVSDIRAHSPGHALQFQDGNEAAIYQRAYAFPAAPDRVRFDFWLNLSEDGNNRGYFQVALQETLDRPNGMNLWIDSQTGDLFYFDGADTQPLGVSITLGAWHRLRLQTVDVSGGFYDIFLDGAAIAHAIPIPGGPPALGWVTIGDPDGSLKATAYLDDMQLLTRAWEKSGTFRLYLRASTLGQSHASLGVMLTDQDERKVYEGRFSLPADPDPKYDELYRWYATPGIAISDGGTYNLTLTDWSYDKSPQVLVDKLLVVWGAPGPVFYATQADDPDSDDDGLLDGVESFATDFWIEAEHHAVDENYILTDIADPKDDAGLNAANSLAVRDDLPNPDPNSGKIVEIAGDAIYPEGTYQVFVRARTGSVKGDPLHVEIKTGAGWTIEDLDLTDRYEWTPVPAAITLSTPGSIAINIYGDPGNPGMLYVDKILLSRLVGHSGSLLKANLPRDVTDPLDPDSDGDGMRPADGGLSGSTGYLTDSWERHLHTNPFSIDTDQDADDLTPNDPDPMFLDDADYNPLNGDSDGDGVNDGYEILSGCMNFADDDTDEDGIIDGNEDTNANGVLDSGETDPCEPDSDGDGIQDGTERGLSAPQGINTKPDVFIPDADPATRTDPLLADTDGDTIPDGVEDANYNGKLDAGEASDAARWDTDGDWLSDWEELNLGIDGFITNPRLWDTDGEGINDGYESGVSLTNPTLADTDSDGLNDYQEVFVYRTDPHKSDSDEDGKPDNQETAAGTNPWNADSDGDGVPDGDEVLWNVDSDHDGLINALDSDSDNDGLNDLQEQNASADPTDPDMDNDGVIDSIELEYGWPVNDPVHPSAPAADEPFTLTVVTVESNVPFINNPSHPGVLVSTGEIQIGSMGTMSLTVVGAVTITLSTGDMAGRGNLRFYIDNRHFDLPMRGRFNIDAEQAILTGSLVSATTLPLFTGSISNTNPMDLRASGALTVGLRTGDIALRGLMDCSLLRVEGPFRISPAAKVLALGTITDTIAFAARIPEPIDKDLTFGEAYALFNLRSGTFRGRAGLQLPLPESLGIEVSLPSAEFLVDFSTWHFMFKIDTSFEIEIGDVNLSIDGPVGATFELAIQSGYLGIEATIEYASMEIEGELEIDLFTEIEPNAWFTPTHALPNTPGFKGNLRILASVPIPLPPSGGAMSLAVTGESVYSLWPPNIVYGFNGEGSFNVGAGPLSFEITLAGVSGAVDFSNDCLYFGGQTGLDLGSIVPGLGDSDLGNIGIGGRTSVAFKYDWSPDPDDYRGYPGLRSNYSGSAGILVGRGMYNYLGVQVDAMILADLTPDSQGGVYISGTLGVPIANAQFVSVAGKITFGGDIYLQGHANLEIAGFQVLTSTVILTNTALTLSGKIDIPMLGSASIAGVMRADATFAFTGTAALKPIGFTLANARVCFNNTGLYINGELHVPGGLANVAVIGNVTTSGFHFEGLADLAIPGFAMANATVILDSQTGLYATGAINVPNAGQVAMTGRFEWNGNFLLTGSGSLSPLGMTIASGAFTLTKQAGVVAFSGTGAIGVGSYTLAAARFSINSLGDISGSANLSFAGVQAGATFNATASDQRITLTAFVSVNKTVNGYGVLGSASFSFSGSLSSVLISATFTGGVTLAGHSKSVSLSINSSGNITVMGFPYPCGVSLSLCPVEFCTADITLDIL